MPRLSLHRFLSWTPRSVAGLTFRLALFRLVHWTEIQKQVAPKNPTRTLKGNGFRFKNSKFKGLAEIWQPWPLSKKKRNQIPKQIAQNSRKRRYFLSNHHRTRLARKSVQLWNAKIWLRPHRPATATCSPSNHHQESKKTHERLPKEITYFAY